MARKTPVELDKPRTLLFDLEALEDLETQLGDKAFGAILQDLAAMGIRSLQAALLTGLRHEDPTLTRNLVRKLLQAHLDAGKSLQPLARAVNEALVATGVFRSTQEADEGNARAEPVAP
jgi:hypothetical protein